MHREGGRGVPRASTAFVLGVCAVILAPLLTYRMGTDQGIYAYAGAALLRGRWPYVSTWYHDFPGAILLHALEICLLGQSPVMLRAFDVFYQLGNAYLIYRITGRVVDRVGGYVAAVTFVLIYQGYGPWNTTQREGFGLFFVLLGFWLHLTSEGRRPIAIASGIGLGLGVAALFKPTLLALAAFYLPLLRRLNRERFTVLLIALVACAAPLAIVTVVYWLHGGLQAFYEACVAYQSVYSRVLFNESLWNVSLSRLRQLGGTAVGLSLGYPAFLFWGRARRERCMLYLAYLGSIVAVLVQGTFAGYHYLPGLGIGAALIGTAFAQLSGLVLGDRQVGHGRLQVSARILIASATLAVALPFYVRATYVRDLVSLHFLEPPRPGEFRIGTVFDFTESWNVAAYIREHTSPSDRIQVWGFEALVYYLAERDAASRFQVTQPLVARAPGHSLTAMQLRWRGEFLRNMADGKPRYVAVVRDDNWWWAPGERTSEQLLDDFPEWKQFIFEHYVFEQPIGRFLIYRFTGTPQNDRARDVRADRAAG